MRHTGRSDSRPPIGGDPFVSEDDDLTVDMSSEAQAARALDAATGTTGLEAALTKWAPIAVLVIICMVIGGILLSLGIWVIVHILKAAF